MTRAEPRFKDDNRVSARPFSTPYHCDTTRACLSTEKEREREREKERERLTTGVSRDRDNVPSRKKERYRRVKHTVETLRERIMENCLRDCLSFFQRKAVSHLASLFIGFLNITAAILQQGRADVHVRRNY